MKGEVIRNNSKTILSEIINDENITNNLEKGVFNFSIWKAKERQSRVHGKIIILLTFIKTS